MHSWMGWNHGTGWGGGLMMLAFWALVILGVFLAVRYVLDRGRSPPGRGTNGAGGAVETALDVLKKRYARGEISREEYTRMKDELQ